MSAAVHTQALDLACGVFLLAAVLVLWRRELSAIIRLLAVQGFALAALVALLAVQPGGAGHEVGRPERLELLALAVGVGALRGWALPRLIRRALVRGGQGRETRPILNVASSLLAAAGLTLLAYAVFRPVAALDPSPGGRAAPVGLAVALIGFFALVTRRRALSQVVGFLLLDNGITAVAFLTTSGVPLIVELGVSFDLLLVTLVLRVLTTRLRATVGDTDPGELRELRD